MVGLHSSDPATVYLSAWARVPGFQIDDMDAALYRRRELLRIYGMRRTLWVVDRDTFPLVRNSSTVQLAEGQFRRMAKILEEHDVADDGVAWLEDVIPRALALIAERGEILARDITEAIPELATKITFRNKSGRVLGTTGVITNTLVLMAIRSEVIRGRPRGTWISSQYRWAEMESWLGEPVPEIPLSEASARLVRRWLHAFGPATERDIRWWTGWRVGQVRRALSDCDAVEVGLEDGQTGFLLADDIEPIDGAGPWVALLPSLDPTPMGWKEREWWIGEHEPVLFDRNGNAGPTIWVDGRVVGGWSQRKSGEIVYEIFDDVGAEVESTVEERAAALELWMGDVTVTPRFRSPHDRALTS